MGTLDLHLIQDRIYKLTEETSLSPMLLVNRMMFPAASQAKTKSAIVISDFNLLPVSTTTSAHLSDPFAIPEHLPWPGTVMLLGASDPVESQ